MQTFSDEHVSFLFFKCLPSVWMCVNPEVENIQQKSLKRITTALNYSHSWKEGKADVLGNASADFRK